jgi:hypothetical protein
MDDKFGNKQGFYKYFSGLFDGEGCIVVSNKHQLIVTIVNTNKICLEYIKSRVGGKLRERKRKKAKFNWKRSFRLYFNGREAVKILKMMFPYLIIKEKEAKLILKFPYIYTENYRGFGVPENVKNKRERIRIKLIKSRRGVKMKEIGGDAQRQKEWLRYPLNNG